MVPDSGSTRGMVVGSHGRIAHALTALEMFVGRLVVVVTDYSRRTIVILNGEQSCAWRGH